MTLSDYYLYLDALSSCAIEGNTFAIKILELKDNDPSKFILELEKFANLDRISEEERG
jgi:hypothetical protein